MLYLGIDQSYNGFGLARLYAGLGYADVSVVTFPSRKHGTGVDRLILIEEWLMKEVYLLSEHPRHVVMEGYARGRANRREEMGELAYAVKHVLRSMLPEDVCYPTIVAPTQLKKFATGNGNATKQQVMAQVHRKWGVQFTNDNAADAYALAKIAEAIDTGTAQTDYEREVIARLTPHTERMSSSKGAA